MANNGISRVIDNSLYSKQALSETRQAFKEYCSIKVTPLPGQQVKLHIAVKQQYQDSCRQIVLEFMNYLLDLSAQKYLNS